MREVKVIIVGDSRSAQAAFSQLNRAAAASQTTLSRVGSGLQTAGTKLNAVGKSWTRNITLPIVGAGVAATKMALDWNTAFTRIAALSNASNKDIASWKSQVLSLAEATGKAPQELADALYYLASAGLKTNQVMDVLGASSKASATGMGTTTDVAKLTAVALNAYSKEGLKAAKVTDVLAAAVTEGTADPAEFAASLGRILPIAQKAGVSFGEVTASLAALSNIGLPVTEGLTAMRGVLAALEGPGTQAGETLKSIGLSADEVRTSIAEQGLLGALRMLDTAAGGNIDTMKKIIPNIRALIGHFGLLGQNADKVDASFHRVIHANGNLDKAFAETQKSPAFKLQQQLAKLRIAAIELGTKLIPIAKDIAEVVGGLAESFSQLDPETQKAIIKWGLLAAALGPVLRLLGGILKVSGGVIGVLGRMSGAAGAAAGARGIGALAAGGAAAGGGTLATVAGGAALPLAGAAAASAGAVWLGDRWKANAQEDAEIVKVFGTNSIFAAEALDRLGSTGNKAGRILHGQFSDQEENLAQQHQDYMRAIAGSDRAFATYTLAMQHAEEKGAELGDVTAEQAKRLAATIGTLEHFGHTLSETKQNQVSNLIAVGDYNGALAIVNDRLDQVVRSHKSLGQSLAVTGSRADGTAERVGDYAGVFGRIPSSKTTTFHINDAAALSKLRNYMTTVSGIPAVLQTQIVATTRHVDIPGRAAGGSVRARSPYLVGEEGIELFVPETSGTIVPNHRLPMGPGDGRIINVYVTAPIKDREWIRDAAEEGTRAALESDHRRDVRIERSRGGNA